MLETIAQAIPFLLKAGPSVKAGFKGIDTKAQKQVAGQMADITNALYNPENPIYQRLNKENQETGRQNVASTIAEVVRQNRKQLSMGRTPLLDQERGGESVFRNLIKGNQDAASQARENSLGQLIAAHRGLGTLYDAYGGLGTRGLLNDQMKVGAYSTIGDTLQNLFNLRPKETINWNQGGASYL